MTSSMTNTTRREDVDDDFDLGTQFVILLGHGGQNCTAICQHLLTSTHAQPTCHPQYGEVSSSDDGHFITQQTCPTTKLGSLVTTPTTTPTMTMTMNGLNSYPRALEIIDGKTRLMPFMIAALSTSS